MLNPSLGHYGRAEAARLLAKDGSRIALRTTALTIEGLNDRRAIPQWIHALQEDTNPHRKHAAARALGWIRPSGRSTALALARCLVDTTQPQPARQEAAESLSISTSGCGLGLLHHFSDVHLRLSRIEAVSLAEANEWLLAREAMGESDRQCELVKAERLGRNHDLAAGF